jgi:hypothetical protein
VCHLTPKHTQAPRKLKLHINSKGRLNQWLTRKELKCGITRDHEAAQSFVDNQRALELLANTISNLTPIEASKMESMSGGEVLGAALITWLKDTERQLRWPGKWWELSATIVRRKVTKSSGGGNVL